MVTPIAIVATRPALSIIVSATTPPVVPAVTVKTAGPPAVVAGTAVAGTAAIAVFALTIVNGPVVPGSLAVIVSVCPVAVSITADALSEIGEPADVAPGLGIAVGAGVTINVGVGTMPLNPGPHAATTTQAPKAHSNDPARVRLLIITGTSQSFVG